jgi:23S rRNA (uridine2552-2'-O)-methyltransferase
MRLDEARKDLYRRLAKEQGYKSRAAFKLIEANEKYGFIKEGDRVIDFGAAPGGWLQVCSRLAGDAGVVVGIDLHEIRLKDKNVRTLRMDVHDPKIAETTLALLGGMADVVLSDLAPSVSGIWDLDHMRQIDMTTRVLELCGSLLRPRGYAFIKVFEGERTREIRDEFRRRFADFKPLKPMASRSESSELYYFCKGWRGEPEPPLGSR